jgi:hypothetical protein
MGLGLVLRVYMWIICWYYASEIMKIVAVLIVIRLFLLIVRPRLL